MLTLISSIHCYNINLTATVQRKKKLISSKSQTNSMNHVERFNGGAKKSRSSLNTHNYTTSVSNPYKTPYSTSKNRSTHLSSENIIQNTENAITPSPPSSTAHNSDKKNDDQLTTMIFSPQAAVQNSKCMESSLPMKSMNNYNTSRTTNQSIHKQYPHRAGRIRVNKQFCTTLEISPGIAEEGNDNEDNGEEDEDLLSYVAFSKSKKKS